MKMNEPVAFNDADIAWAFPSVDPGIETVEVSYILTCGGING